MHIKAEWPRRQRCFDALKSLRDRVGDSEFRSAAVEIDTPQLENLERRLDQTNSPQSSSAFEPGADDGSEASSSG
jgi:hypothetical protein